MLKKPILGFLALATTASMASAACCYFAAINKDVTQPGQRAFITWDENTDVESFTVQPLFEGNAVDFGMVIPTPSRPKLQEMPRDFFRALAVFTILEPMDMTKFKPVMRMAAPSASKMEGAQRRDKAVRVLEGGIVGSLDYKILEADRADALFEWLKENKYQYKGDQKTLDYYVERKWIFTVMKIDPRQMKKRADGTYLGEVTPTRFTFTASTPIYPLHLTQISVKDQTDVLLYVMARKKMDMEGAWSYEPNFFSMWQQAMSWAIPEKLTAQEKQWQAIAAKWGPQPNSTGAQLEWAGKLTDTRLAVLTDKSKYKRDAPVEEVTKLKVLQGHLKQDWFLTKFRKSFAKQEMTHDIKLFPARVKDVQDDLEYVSILPTSPP